jgi:hypothetical protein
MTGQERIFVKKAQKKPIEKKGFKNKRVEKGNRSKRDLKKKKA